MTPVLYSVARNCVRHRFVVLAVWLVAAAALVAVSHRLGDNTNDNLSLPGTNSQKATDALQSSFPAQANGVSPIVLHAREREADRLQVCKCGQRCGSGRGQGAATWRRCSTR